MSYIIAFLLGDIIAATAGCSKFRFLLHVFLCLSLAAFILTNILQYTSSCPCCTRSCPLRLTSCRAILLWNEHWNMRHWCNKRLPLATGTCPRWQFWAPCLLLGPAYGEAFPPSLIIQKVCDKDEQRQERTWKTATLESNGEEHDWHFLQHFGAVSPRPMKSRNVTGFQDMQILQKSSWRRLCHRFQRSLAAWRGC